MNPPPKPPPNDNPPPPPSSSAPPHPISSSSSSLLSSPPQNPSQPLPPSSSSSTAPQYPPPPPPPPLAPAAAPGAAPAAESLGPSKLPLDIYAWAELEEEFIKRMDTFGKEERDIQEEFAEWVAVFTAWASVTSVWEEERGYKRLRTRISWVQNAEKNLEEKRLQYVTAIKAFENVVALLNGF